MTRMERLAATLGDVDGLLLDIDAEQITESLERGEAPDARPDDGCPWCQHDFHGLPCQPPESAPPWMWWPCRCDSALVPLDDTWRPPVAHDDVALLMHRTGLDGWSAPRLQEIQARAAWRPLMAAFSDAAREIGALFDGFGESIRKMVESLPPGALPVAVHVRRGDGRSAHRRVVDFADQLGNAHHIGIESPVPLVRFDEPRRRTETREDDVRAAALAHRRQRGTGPARPTAQHARRPRQHR